MFTEKCSRCNILKTQEVLKIGHRQICRECIENLQIKELDSILITKTTSHPKICFHLDNKRMNSASQVKAEKMCKDHSICQNCFKEIFFLTLNTPQSIFSCINCVQRLLFMCRGCKKLLKRNDKIFPITCKYHFYCKDCISNNKIREAGCNYCSIVTLIKTSEDFQTPISQSMYSELRFLSQKPLDLKMIFHDDHTLNLFFIYNPNQFEISCNVCKSIIQMLGWILIVDQSAHDRYLKYNKEIAAASQEIENQLKKKSSFWSKAIKLFNPGNQDKSNLEMKKEHPDISVVPKQIANLAIQSAKDDQLYTFNQSPNSVIPCSPNSYEHSQPMNYTSSNYSIGFNSPDMYNHTNMNNILPQSYPNDFNQMIPNQYYGNANVPYIPQTDQNFTSQFSISTNNIGGQNNFVSQSIGCNPNPMMPNQFYSNANLAFTPQANQNFTGRFSNPTNFVSSQNNSIIQNNIPEPPRYPSQITYQTPNLQVGYHNNLLIQNHGQPQNLQPSLHLNPSMPQNNHAYNYKFSIQNAPVPAHTNSPMMNIPSAQKQEMFINQNLINHQAYNQSVSNPNLGIPKAPLPQSIPKKLDLVEGGKNLPSNIDPKLPIVNFRPQTAKIDSYSGFNQTFGSNIKQEVSKHSCSANEAGQYFEISTTKSYAKRCKTHGELLLLLKCQHIICVKGVEEILVEKLEVMCQNIKEKNIFKLNEVNYNVGCVSSCSAENIFALESFSENLNVIMAKYQISFKLYQYISFLFNGGLLKFEIYQCKCQCVSLGGSGCSSNWG